MQSVVRCPSCGQKLAGNEPGGLCPACIARVTFGFDSDGLGELAPPDRLRQFGDYELLAELGRGGMGVVYKAHQRSLDRFVAIKMILAGHFASRADIQRFHIEAQNAARLRHPHIVNIHEVGEFEGQPFYSMELVEGQKLSALVQGRPLSAKKAAQYVRAVAEAVHAGHEQGIIHRDLKPANILIDSRDEPRVTDFGLSKQIASDSTLTLTGQALGSPGYMAPEQAGGKPSPRPSPIGMGEEGALSASSDIYSLGAVLYHLITARPPFHAASVAEVLHQVLNIDPISPRLLNPAVPRDLETICIKCLAKEPSRRYASAQHLAEDLHRFLHDEPIRARPVTAAEKTWRWCRRHPAVASLSLAVVVLLLTVAIGSLWTAVRLEKARGVAVRERGRAERTTTQLRLRTAEKLLEEEDSASGIALMARMLRDDPTNRIAVGWIMDALGRSAYPLPVTPALRDSSVQRHARFSPDGRKIATAAGGAFALWNAETGQELARTQFRARIYYLEFSPDGTKVACACENGTARIFDAENGQEVIPPIVHGTGTDRPVFSARFSPDATRLVTSTRLGFARVWSVKTGEPLTPELRHQDEVNFAEFSPDGGKVLSASEDGTAMIWDSHTGKPLISPIRHQAEVWMGRFSPDGTRVATVSRDRTARVWDAQSGQALTEPLLHNDFVEYVEFSPDGRFIVTSSYDQTARIWDARTGVLVAPPLRHAERVNSATFSPDGQRVLTASMDGTARVWDVATGDPLARAMSHTRRIWYAEFSPNGQRMVTASADFTAQIWQIKPAANPVQVRQHGSVVLDAKFANNGSFFASACYDGNVRVWNTSGVRTDRLLTPMKHPKGVWDIEISPNGQWLATLCRDWKLRLWNRRTGELVGTSQRPQEVVFADFNSTSTALLFGGSYSAWLWDLQSGGASVPASRFGDGEKHWDTTGPVTTGKLSPDGKLAAIGIGIADHVLIWDLENNRQSGEPLQHGHGIPQVEFSPDGQYLLTSCRDATARVWDLRTHQLHSPPLKHNLDVLAAHFDGAGNRVVTASADGTARVWNAHTGAPLTEPLNHRGSLVCATFSPDGTQILTGSADGTVRLWDALTGNPIAPPLVHRGDVTAACFSPDGQTILSASRDGTARLWSPPPVPSQIPVWLPDFAEAMAGKRVNELGAFEFVPTEALQEVRAKVMSLPPESACVGWARKFF